MAELTARRDSLLDYLPGNWQQAINTNPLLNALGRAMNRKYGLLPPVAAGTAAALNQDESQN